MKTQLQLDRWLSAVCLVLLGACGGGGINVSPTINVPLPPPLPPAPVTEPVTALGVISAFGSVTVNGVIYQTNGTTVTMNGQPALLSDLNLGQIVVLDGTIEAGNPRGNADRIDYESTVLGPLENIDADLGQLVVMGQTVVIDAETVFDPSIDASTLTGLAIGSVAQISGFLNATDEIRATRIEPATASTQAQLIGRVTDLDTANMLFRLGRQTVDYSSAVLVDLPGGMPADGLLLLARGSLTNGILVVGELESIYDSTGGPPGERTHSQGTVTRYNSATDFDVNGFPVTTDAGTAYVNGTVSDLQSNAEITVDGDFSSDGSTIVANEINFGSLLAPTTTLTFDLSDFTEIAVSTVFRVTVTQGTDFSVEVTVDSDDANRVDVTKTGSTLNIALLTGQGNNDNIETLHAFVTMPALNGLDLAGVIHATLNDFNQASMTVNVGGVSQLRGNALMIGDLTADVSGVSSLDFGEIRPIGNANINVIGVSQATLNMGIGTTMTGSVGTGQGSGISTLFYYGTNVTNNVSVGSLSRVTRLGDTRP